MHIRPFKNLSGVIRLPGDKAVTHRAVILSGIAQGTAKITNALMGTDCLATIDCMARLGAKIDTRGGILTVTGADMKLRSGLKLYCGNSGTTLKLLTGLLAGAGVSAQIDGEDALRKRPLAGFIEAFNGMGAKITSAGGGVAPLVFKPAPLKGCEIFFSGGVKLKTALMLAGLFAKGGITLYEDNMAGDHSEILFEEMSADIERGPGRLTVRPSRLKSVNINIPGDISSAAYFIAAATLIPDSHVLLRKVGINPARTAIIDAVNSCGGKVTVMNTGFTGGEKTADLLAEYSPGIRPFNITGEIAPGLLDEFPILAVMACFAVGRSRLSGGETLRHKDGDRIESTVNALKSMGARIYSEGGDIVIDGGGVLNGGAVIDPGGDHRIAMSMAVAAAASLEGAEILTPEVVNASYPGFFEEFILRRV